MLDGELAVPYNPKSAYAGSKILPEKLELGLFFSVKEVAGPRVPDDYEPRQVREEAAVNNSLCSTKQSGQNTCFYCETIFFSVQSWMHGQGIFLNKNY